MPIGIFEPERIPGRGWSHNGIQLRQLPHRYNRTGSIFFQDLSRSRDAQPPADNATGPSIARGGTHHTNVVSLRFFGDQPFRSNGSRLVRSLFLLAAVFPCLEGTGLGHLQVQTNPIFGLPHPHDNVRPRFVGEGKQPGLFAGRLEMKEYPRWIVRKKGNRRNINESIGLHRLFGNRMNFDQGIRRQSEGRWHHMSMACPAVAQHNGSSSSGCIGIGINVVATFVAAGVVVVLALQQRRKGHRPVDVVALEFEFVRFHLQQELIPLDRHKIRQLIVPPGVGHLVAVWIDRRKMIVVQTQQARISRSPGSEF